MRHFRVMFAAMLALFVGTETAAHHSTASFVVRVTDFHGQIVDTKWRNPHVLLTIAVETKQGILQHLIFMVDNIKNLERAGVKQEMLAIGSTVGISGRRSGRDENWVLAERIRFQDAGEFKLWSGS